ncbi:MAG: PTS sugar transporter subunit IIA [Granulosicoccus sp.]
MDLSELLTPERIRCQCNVQSKKRALQTLAEMLSQSLLLPEDTEDTDAEPHAEQNSTMGSIASRLLKSRPKTDEEQDEKGALSEMGILDAFISRERLGSTCLDHGFALPHSRISCINKPVAAFITLADGVDYNASDKQPVDLVLGLLVPEECNDEHLKILATLAKRFSDAEFREKVRAYATPSELYGYLANLAPV